MDTADRLLLDGGAEKRAWCDAQSMPPFSALVAAWNERENIDRHIRSFLDLSWPGAQLVLCAGGNDGTYEAAKRWEEPSVTVLEQRVGQGKQAALRESLKFARHDLLVLTDADCEFEEGAIRELLGPVLDGKYEVSSGGSRPHLWQSSIPIVQYQHARDTAYFDRQGEQLGGLLGRNAVITRSRLGLAGNFEEEVATGTDYHLSKVLSSQGVSIGHARSSRIPSEFPSSMGSYLRMWRRWIKNLFIHGSDRIAPTLIRSTLFALLVLAGPVAWFVFPAPWSLVASLPFAAALASRYRDMTFAKRAGIQLRVVTYLLIPLFTLLDQVAVVAALLDVLTPTGRRRW